MRNFIKRDDCNPEWRGCHGELVNLLISRFISGGWAQNETPLLGLSQDGSNEVNMFYFDFIG